MSGSSKRKKNEDGVTAPAVVIVWDPELLEEHEYAELVEAIGNVVRAHGGLGVKLLRPQTFGTLVGEGVPT